MYFFIVAKHININSNLVHADWKNIQIAQEVFAGLHWHSITLHIWMHFKNYILLLLNELLFPKLQYYSNCWIFTRSTVHSNYPSTKSLIKITYTYTHDFKIQTLAYFHKCYSVLPALHSIVKFEKAFSLSYIIKITPYICYDTYM